MLGGGVSGVGVTTGNRPLTFSHTRFLVHFLGMLCHVILQTFGSRSAEFIDEQQSITMDRCTHSCFWSANSSLDSWLMKEGTLLARSYALLMFCKHLLHMSQVHNVGLLKEGLQCFPSMQSELMCCLLSSHIGATS